jgi:hypothetical protein
MQDTNKSTEKSEMCKCPYCGASMTARWERLSKGLVQSLVKFKQQVIILDRNKIHLQDDLKLTKTEYNNFQKLRYHAAIAKYINPDTKQHEAGYWLLTKRGNQLIKNMIEVPLKVKVFRNKIIDKCDERAYASDILKDVQLPVWDEKEDFKYEYADIQDIEEVKFDANGQGLLFN